MSECPARADQVHELVPEVRTILCSLQLLPVDDGYECTRDMYTLLLSQSVCSMGLHHAVSDIIDHIVCCPLRIRMTGEFVDLWGGVWEVRRDKLTVEAWTDLETSMRALVSSGVARRSHNGAHVYSLVPDVTGARYDSCAVEQVPWRMIALRGLLWALMSVGAEYPYVQVELLHAMQVACVQVRERLEIDARVRVLFPVAEHRACLQELMSAVPRTIMPFAWLHVYQRRARDGRGRSVTAG